MQSQLILKLFFTAILCEFKIAKQLANFKKRGQNWKSQFEQCFAHGLVDINTAAKWWLWWHNWSHMYRNQHFPTKSNKLKVALYKIIWAFKVWLPVIKKSFKTFLSVKICFYIIISIFFNRIENLILNEDKTCFKCTHFKRDI